MDEASQPQPLSSGPVGGNNTVRNIRNGGGNGNAYNVQNELLYIKQDAMQVRNAVILLEQEKDSLRKAIRKLKLENGRIKQKVKNLQETVQQLIGSTQENGVNGGATEADLDYDDLGRDFLLVGGVRDPLSLRYEVSIRDADGVEHKSAERYYWYKMAEKFSDNDAKQKILQAPNVSAAEAAMKEIKNFDEEAWNKEKLEHWENGQLLKLKQVRRICSLLVYSKVTYIAVASQDKCFGTGWRKNREESNKPIFWDGQNKGGKILMKLRQQLKESFTWQGPYEEEETQKEFKNLQRFVWRRVDPSKRLLNPRAPVGRGRGAIGPRRAGVVRSGYAGGPVPRN